jgi:membrane fusion protein (multidrug efflux system)
MSFWRRYRYVFLAAVVIVMAFIGMQILSGLREKPKTSDNKGIARLVNAAVVEKGRIESSLQAFGRLRSQAPINLVSEVAGVVTAGAVPFLPGQEFRRGQLLLKVDTRQSELDLMTAKSQLLNALAGFLPEVKIEFPEAYEPWEAYFATFAFDRPLAQLPEAANARIKLFLARYNVYQLYFSARNLEIRLEKHYIRAPFTGVITRADLRPGATARQGSIFGGIIKTTNMEVEVQLRAAERRWLSADAEVDVYVDEQQKPLTGKIVRIAKTVDPQTETLPVFVALSGDKTNLRDGEFVTVNFPPLAIENAFRLPDRAIYDNRYVYLVRNGELVRQEVEAVHFESESVLIGAGLAAGDTVVTQPLQGVAPGMAVRARIGEQP